MAKLKDKRQQPALMGPCGQGVPVGRGVPAVGQAARPWLPDAVPGHSSPGRAAGEAARLLAAGGDGAALRGLPPALHHAGQ